MLRAPRLLTRAALLFSVVLDEQQWAAIGLSAIERFIKPGAVHTSTPYRPFVGTVCLAQT
jgi:hypothetical protein